MVTRFWEIEPFKSEIDNLADYIRGVYKFGTRITNNNILNRYIQLMCEIKDKTGSKQYFGIMTKNSFDDPIILNVWKLYTGKTIPSSINSDDIAQRNLIYNVLDSLYRITKKPFNSRYELAQNYLDPSSYLTKLRTKYGSDELNKMTGQYVTPPSVPQTTTRPPFVINEIPEEPTTDQPYMQPAARVPSTVQKEFNFFELLQQKYVLPAAVGGVILMVLKGRK
jgi:hypothetical protein